MRRRGKSAKKLAQESHLRNRAAVRFGVAVTPQHERRIIRQIQKGELDLVEKQSHRISLWRGELAGEPCVFVYDRRRKTLVTVLHPEPEEGAA